MSGTLYIVSTPIGNLEDITLRALRILREVQLIAAEDTRHTRKLLNHFEIATPATAYHEHNKLTRLDYILEKLKTGEDIALVSDAGTPCLSDPGWELVRAALDDGIKVDAVPGAAAPLVALVLSGFAPQEFTFAGFPPRKKSELIAWLARFRQEVNRRPLIFFEAPHRLVATLETAFETLGDRPVAVCRELTKLHQEVRRELLSEAIAHFKANEPRGEFSLVFAPASATAALAEEEADRKETVDPRQRLRELKAAGLRAKEAVEVVCGETGLPRRQVYELWLNLD
ncbi:MAG TPA: 16S rRNA (cytidine(1402)-2'-O)-methyltransferase [Chloroflexia bacterium]|nr:16S rRNA (cytidine(1402)-2'-O)-methyltransferase [Chloroflexia bacterium]